MLVVLVLSIVINSVTQAAINLWIRNWFKDSDPRQLKFVLIYTLMIFFQAFFPIMMTQLLKSTSIYLALFQDMMISLLYAPLSFFETTPSARVVNRLAKDLPMSDKVLAHQFAKCVLYLSGVLGML